MACAKLAFKDGIVFIANNSSSSGIQEEEMLSPRSPLLLSMRRQQQQPPPQYLETVFQAGIKIGLTIKLRCKLQGRICKIFQRRPKPKEPLSGDDAPRHASWLWQSKKKSFDFWQQKQQLPAKRRGGRDKPYMVNTHTMRLAFETLKNGTAQQQSLLFGVGVKDSSLLLPEGTHIATCVGNRPPARPSRKRIHLRASIAFTSASSKFNRARRGRD